MKESDLNKIGGEGVVVEIDESKFGKRYHHKVLMVGGVWVFGIGANKEKKLFFKVVEKRDAANIFYSNCRKTYPKIQELVGHNFTHLKVNDSTNFDNQETGACTNNI